MNTIPAAENCTQLARHCFSCPPSCDPDQLCTHELATDGKELVLTEQPRWIDSARIEVKSWPIVGVR